VLCAFIAYFLLNIGILVRYEGPTFTKIENLYSIIINGKKQPEKGKSKK